MSPAPDVPPLAQADLARLFPAATRFYASVPSLSWSRTGFRSLPVCQACGDEEGQAFLKSLGQDLEEPVPGLRWEFVQELLDLPAIFDGQVAFALLDPDDDDWVLSLASSQGASRVSAFAEKLAAALRASSQRSPSRARSPARTS
ncbi:MAG: hypothetical protein HY812_02250 [Planctomycetes bacterium]|nr:hypothetical protein [Planctomycetota bacterium]